MRNQKSAHGLSPVVDEVLGKPSGVTDVEIEAATVSIVVMITIRPQSTSDATSPSAAIVDSEVVITADILLVGVTICIQRDDNDKCYICIYQS